MASPTEIDEMVKSAAIALFVGGGIGLLVAVIMVKLGYGRTSGFVSRTTQQISKRLRRQKKR